MFTCPMTKTHQQSYSYANLIKTYLYKDILIYRRALNQ